jgi:hypothetical protein
MDKTITWEQFVKTYKPKQNLINKDAPIDGFLFETFGEEMDEISKQNPKNVWTFTEEEDGFFLQNGIHYVNRMGYMVTEVPWEEEVIVSSV